MRKKLVVSGDSWTTRAHRPWERWWSEYLADMLGMDVVNVGLGGVGNEFIYNHIVDKLSSAKNVGLAIVMWSDPDRKNIYGPGSKTVKIASLPGPTSMMKSLRWFNAFQNYCESNKIPYMQCSAFNPVTNDIVSQIIDHPVFYKMNEDHFYGWPIFHQIGGFNMSDKLNEIDPEMKKLRVSDEDTHPNTEGHKLIAELLYSHYVKIYV